MAKYICYQADNEAQAVQIFDSWATGSGGLLERLPLTGVDVVSLDWIVDMADGRKRLGPNVAVQGNVDPVVLFGSKGFITNRINDTVKKACKGKHILNLRHGIKVGAPEENVGRFFEIAKGLRY
ncbi:uroporphyrinogen decarboxylase, chloroplastic-like [Lycium barbarum]|uniref:uroporphyrinogen decarboxylase, chloroplastic-like n=1 Tax=Lycium barbarum TaxID=112863 RepID=UPI00293F53B1|nr:uroporphyrinogen decarboxylase, chloroplastic-like [Lycium barbarum]